jgi:hypothetical protein
MRDYAYQDTGMKAHRLAVGGFDLQHPDPSKFMGGCKIDEALCVDVYREDLSTRPDFTMSMSYHGLIKKEDKQSAYINAVDGLMKSCRAHVGQFVLIYFPPTIAARDICANKGKGTARTIPARPEALSATAAMTAITIGTDTLSGDFKFTSPSMYLAYDSAKVWRGCSQIGATHVPVFLPYLVGN